MGIPNLQPSELSWGLCGLAAVEWNEFTVSIRASHFGLFTHYLESLYIRQGLRKPWSMTENTSIVCGVLCRDCGTFNLT